MTDLNPATSVRDEAPVGRAVLHVGTPKSGTTYLQRALRFNRDGLRAAGVNLPDGGGPTVFHAAIEMRDAYDAWGKDPEQLAGTWRRLCHEARQFPGTTVLSHELFGAASAAQAEATLAELEGLEVHLVLTVRDLPRQVTSEWQERIKNGAVMKFAVFERRVRRNMERRDWSSLFWRQQHMVDILDRWASGLPPERVHVVVAPPAGAEPGVLWQRFAEAVGFDPDAFDPTLGADRGNQSLGTAQIALLRRINAALDGALPPGKYHPVVKRNFAQRILAAQSGSRPECPPGLVSELAEVAREQNEEVESRGYCIHGSLEELIPEVPAGPPVAPDDVSAEETIDAAVEALVELITEETPVVGLRTRVRRRILRALRLR